MEEDLLCSGESWWNPKMNSGFHASPSSLSCSTATAEIEGREFSATDLLKPKARSCDESTGSACDSSITSQDLPSFSLSPSSMNWPTQALLNGGRSESNFQALLQQDLCPKPYMIKQDFDSDLAHSAVVESSTENLLTEQQRFGSFYRCPSTIMLQELVEPDMKPQQSIYDDDQGMNCFQSSPMMVPSYQGSLNELWQNSWAKFSHHLLKSSSLPKQQFSNYNPLQFTNSTPFWNPSAAASVADLRSMLCSLTPSQFVMQPKTTNCSNLAAKMNQRIQDSCSSSTHKTGSEPPIKKPRMETPSPLPTFKVRKEKLGDRITALQQLVSPFGKTDTASVLQEAIEYIKFLHDQVNVLSSPYLKNGHAMQQKQISDKLKDCDELSQDLRSHGLCLVPMTSMFPLASETTADFWHPTFGGTFR
ncbi:hypothetical protein Cni_G23878 [Canna indica]|uniref:BHLH domain-containing protein n=1 Tax=Canna indica TaxID=4628 RepID=A0AAQ3KX07_9LILI|nr:hypothetical protein Cni_G23878 [Canna indica]